MRAILLMKIFNHSVFLYISAIFTLTLLLILLKKYLVYFSLLKIFHFINQHSNKYQVFTFDIASNDNQKVSYLNFIFIFYIQTTLIKLHISSLI